MPSRFTLWIVGLALLALTGCQRGYAQGVEHVAQKFSPSVGQARTTMDRDLRNLLLVMSQDDRLSKNERMALLESTIMASGGSAFAVERHGDETWFITNAHVVEGVEGVTLSLDRGRSSGQAKIIFVAANDDVAVISLPAEVPLLEFGGAVFEGEPVMSLGYPGVRGLGLVYQVADGIVSNECFKDPIYGTGDDCLIQHTATIDHGNSGGPLVDARHGRVLGVNTYGFSRSTSVAYATIPAERVQVALKQANVVAKKGEDPAWLKAELEETVQEFLDEMLSNQPLEQHVGYMISRRLLVRNGLANYLAWDLQSKELAMVMLGATETLTIATLSRISEDLHDACDEHEPKLRINASDVRFSTREQARAIVRCGKERREIVWTFELGRWRVVDYWSEAIEEVNVGLLKADVPEAETTPSAADEPPPAPAAEPPAEPAAPSPDEGCNTCPCQ